MAVQFRYKNLAPDLSLVTEHLEALAKFLIRRAQLTGPYELLGRTNIASDAWVAYEKARLGKLRVAAKDEKNSEQSEYHLRVVLMQLSEQGSTSTSSAKTSANR